MRLLAVLASLSSPLAAQGNGLLLGVEHAGTYRTLWITMSAGRAEVAAELTDLVVPRPDGFWHVGIATLCEHSGTRQVIWQTRLGRAPAVRARCPEPVPIDPTDAEALERAAAGSSEPEGCNASTAAIHAVLPGWVSEGYTFGQTEACEPRGGRWRDSSAVRRFDARPPVGLREVMGGRAEQAYADAVARGFAELSREMSCPEPIAEEYDHTSWIIEHRRGAWRALAAYNENMGDCVVWSEMGPALPVSLTGRVSPTVVMDTAKVRDWAVSPDGRYVAALAKVRQDEVRLAVYAVRDRKPDRELLTHDIGSQSRIVTAEWATGRYVTEWTRAMRSAPRR
ncbi:MAG TPA: hypothetical protein VEB59_12020 [Gemmatimonadales bacterium]|nr:hypothetical protein [Gemmatimonadales bacterium]